MCVWVEDADKLDFDSTGLSVVYKNKTVTSALSESHLGIAGIKGQGKTFLIKVKRKKFENNPSILCLPKSKMVDTIDSSICINSSLIGILKDYNVWVSIWKVAICCALLGNSAFKEILLQSTIKLDKETEFLINSKNRNSQPSTIIRYILSYELDKFRRVLADTSNLILLIDEISQGVCVFIDKVDQSFSEYAKNFNGDSSTPRRSRNASIWQYAQYGLAEASYDIYTNGRRHIKIYYTIRHEALIDCHMLNKDKARNIGAFISQLIYTKSDLYQMFRIYVEHEDDNKLTNADYKWDDPSRAFVGVENISSNTTPIRQEDVFDYIYRHTLKRPYDLMKICRAIYLQGNELSSQTIRNSVYSSSKEIVDTYFQELSTFLPCDYTELKAVLRMVGGNIFNVSIMRQICTQYNKREHAIWNCNKNCKRCDSIQPFSILYNLGLIGYLKDGYEQGTTQQIFSNIGSSILQLNSHILPLSDYYFLHPCLCSMVKDDRNKLGLEFEQNSRIIIGDEYPFPVTMNTELNKYITRQMNRVYAERIFISSTIRDLASERTLIRDVLLERGLNPIMSEKHDFELGNAQNVHAHDHCIDELLKCKSLIFIIGTTYGGEYAGEKYKKIADTIIERSEGKIKNPSISLVEYYAAVTKRIKCYAFISKNVLDCIQSKAHEGIDGRLVGAVDFLTHLTVGRLKTRGNWISPYNDLDDLIRRVNNLNFSTRAKRM